MARFENRSFGSDDKLPALVCLSHLRWDFVFQRPQHLMTRFARERRVFFFEEPIYDSETPRLDIERRLQGVWVVVPHLAPGMSEAAAKVALEKMVKQLVEHRGIENFVLWFYTPMAVAFTRHLRPAVVVYDCMDELSLFRGAPALLSRREAELFRMADIVLTGGASLYAAKRAQHPNVHFFPSSIDAAHFAQARRVVQDPPDQAVIPHPRLGYFGVIDERMDVDLIRGLAEARPDWHLVMVGPVVKIERESLPQTANTHYLGSKDYAQLPAYLAGWDVALIPFAQNEATRYISPTKTPEYLAGGKPVVSTPIRDVVHPYGDKGLVRIAGHVNAFVKEIEDALRLERSRDQWLEQVDEFLAQTSWETTWGRIKQLIETVPGASARSRTQRAAERLAGYEMSID